MQSFSERRWRRHWHVCEWATMGVSCARFAPCDIWCLCCDEWNAFSFIYLTFAESFEFKWSAIWGSCVRTSFAPLRSNLERFLVLRDTEEWEREIEWVKHAQTHGDHSNNSTSFAKFVEFLYLFRFVFCCFCHVFANEPKFYADE